MNEGHLRFPSSGQIWDKMYAIGWKIGDKPSDKLTRLFDRVKGDPTGQWARKTGSHLVSSIASEFPTNPAKKTLVVAAPGASDIRVSPSSIQAVIAKQIATTYGFIDGSARIGQKKARESFSRNKLNKTRRKEVLDGNLTWDAEGDNEFSRLIVVDDFITTGTTANAILRLVTAAAQGPIERLVVVLGRIETLEFDPDARNTHLTTDGFWSTFDPRGEFQ